MKKISLILLIALFLNMCACSSNNLTNAINKADNLVKQWNNEGYCACMYKSEYVKEYDGFETSVYIVYARYPSEVDYSDYPTAVKNLITNDLRDKVYPQLAEIFKDEDVSIGIILSDHDGKNTYSTIMNGEKVIH